MAQIWTFWKICSRGQTSCRLNAESSIPNLRQSASRPAGHIYWLDGKNWLEKCRHFSNQFYPEMIRGDRYPRFTAYFTSAFSGVLRRCAAEKRIALCIGISTKSRKQKDFRNYPKVQNLGADGGSRTPNLLVTNEMLCH